MSENTLYDKVWDKHVVGKLSTGQSQVFVGRHLMHEVTSPQAFEMLDEKKMSVKHPELTFATMDHIIPTDNCKRPYKDPQAEAMASELEKNVKKYDVSYFDKNNGQGVCHVVFPEKGIIWPGQVVVCGDSHTCTHGAFGALAFGIGTTQVSHVLATQTLAMDKLKVMLVEFDKQFLKGITAKDVALYLINKIGVNGGVGYAIEFGGNAVKDFNMEERMTLCNMAVEAGARSGYVNPDETTYNYIRNRKFAPSKVNFDKMVEYWNSIVSDKNAVYDKKVFCDLPISPMITWGTNPAHSISIDANMPKLEEYNVGKEREEVEDAYKYMGLEPGKPILGTPVDVVFIGSCTNGRLSDLEAAAQILEGRKVNVRTLVVPGSEEVMRNAEENGIADIVANAGAEWRDPGCSMCLAMNPDRLIGQERSASTSNRNFKGRQGSPTGRTHLMSPYTAAATAIEGKIADPRKYL
ncbi:MAG: 3-isopropylmalate dehydratase large subunit [Candidatus Woesearchaeota archaeon]|jgi:3-isopropylmalate/(R)-2-methylmalate dehydratase large subunit